MENSAVARWRRSTIPAPRTSRNFPQPSSKKATRIFSGQFINSPLIKAQVKITKKRVIMIQNQEKVVIMIQNQEKVAIVIQNPEKVVVMILNPKKVTIIQKISNHKI